MKLFVGLGNPGSRHVGSRHNIGFRIALAFARARGVAIDTERFDGLFGVGSAPGDPAPVASGAESTETLAFLLPLTFVNGSGRAVVAATLAHPELDVERDLLVAYDDLDLPLGRIRLRSAGGAGGHNGMASIIDLLGTTHFARLRFGIGRPPEGVGVTDFVLERFSPDEEVALPALVARARDAAQMVFREGIAAAMDRFNADPVA